jgi:hypothetical protein
LIPFAPISPTRCQETIPIILKCTASEMEGSIRFLLIQDQWKVFRGIPCGSALLSEMLHHKRKHIKLSESEKIGPGDHVVFEVDP